MVAKKRMGGMRLSDFGGQSTTVEVEPEHELLREPEPETPTDSPAPVVTEEEKPETLVNPPTSVVIEEEKPETPTKATKRKLQPKKEERLVVVNIRIKESQQEWLTDTAKQVRQNNDAPVPASERVYPQHLIQTAIDLLRTADVDWSQVKNVEELKKALKL